MAAATGVAGATGVAATACVGGGPTGLGTATAAGGGGGGGGGGAGGVSTIKFLLAYSAFT